MLYDACRSRSWTTFWIIFVLPQQRRVAVTESVPALQRNDEFCSNRLDVELHDFRHPVGLLAVLLGARKDEIAVSRVRRLLSPRKQFSDQVLIEWDWLLRGFCLHVTLVLQHDGTLGR